MDKQTLGRLFSGKVFVIPEYQRGYAWEDKHCNDLIEDIDSLVDDHYAKSHYVGTIVAYSTKENKDYNLESVEVFDVVDGQQRLASISLYLSVIIRELAKEESEYEKKTPIYLYNGETCRLTLNNECDLRLFRHLLENGDTRTNKETTPHQGRLINATKKFSKHIEEQVKKRRKESTKYLKGLFNAITNKLVFTYYAIDEECEIGMTFELMNSRGKKLSILELLKNYFKHWLFRNTDNNERNTLTEKINSAWKDIYSNLANSGSDDQCLQIAWTLFCSYQAKHWDGYNSFKKYIPLRDFSKKTKEEVKEFLSTFIDNLVKVSKHYSIIINPSKANNLCEDEFEWLTKFENINIIASFLPLMVAARIRVYDQAKDDYINLLKALERFAFRVFLIVNKRGNTGKADFYRHGNELFSKKGYEKGFVKDLVNKIDELTHWYSPKEKFIRFLENPRTWWYANGSSNYRKRLKHILYEYEKHLLHEDGHEHSPKIVWAKLKEASIGHILPQTQTKEWKEKWNQEHIDTYLHDIGNLVLTNNNSAYSNFTFECKKGKSGEGICYANSDIRQEREIAAFDDWTVDSLKKRREKLVNWIIDRWSVKDVQAENKNDEKQVVEIFR